MKFSSPQRKFYISGSVNEFLKREMGEKIDEFNSWIKEDEKPKTEQNPYFQEIFRICRWWRFQNNKSFEEKCINELKNGLVGIFFKLIISFLSFLKNKN
jgi:hypothetical protein